MKWFTYTRGSIPLHRISVALLGTHKAAARLCGYSIYSALYFNQPNKLWWSWSEQEIRGLGEKLLKKLSTPGHRQQHFAKLERHLKDTIRASERVRKLDLTTLTNEQLIKQYQDLEKTAVLAHGISNIDIDVIDISFESFFQEKLEKVIPKDISQAEYVDVYKKLTIPAYVSFVKKEEAEIIRLALQKDIKGKQIDKLYQKFWWTKIGWENLRPHTKGYFERRIKKFRRRKNLSDRIEKFSQDLNKVKKDRREIIEKYNLPNAITSWLEVIDKYSYYHDLRKEMQVRGIYSFYLILEEIARRLKLKKADLEFFHGGELVDLLRGEKLDCEEIKKRQRATCVLVTKKDIKTWSGQEAERKFKSELSVGRGRKKVIKGKGVSLGKVKAKAKVCSGSAEALRKVRRGDVLVCGMTLPDCVPAMKRAAAIVTDEGGITCHAAIISRELGIPCIVGTKNATAILQDGDRIEVDADKGIVRKL